ncbi:35381_t:CDS:2 [Gigaspora margarita]|uniref:35381_t:CDS:1 n=1 Tax=Gigaspora margarita TaxID=4874 RepID=A0ABN7V689_GIGMA|nr:35381_t:CDS:2 [Gigaspora margarita]
MPLIDIRLEVDKALKTTVITTNGNRIKALDNQITRRNVTIGHQLVLQVMCKSTTRVGRITDKKDWIDKLENDNEEQEVFLFDNTPTEEKGVILQPVIK